MSEREEKMTPSETRAAKRIKEHVANLGNPEGEIARRAEDSLIRYYGGRALEPLIGACADANPQVRSRAVWALGKTRYPRAYETILRLTDDPEGYVRYDAAIALGVLGDERAIASLVALMQKPDEQHCVDSAAAMGLDRLGQPAVPALLNVLQSGSNEARRLAASVLGSIGDRGAVEPLARFLTHSDKDLRIAAIEALAQLGGSDCLALLQPCLQDPVPEVRETAEYWIEEMRAE
jgi:HEAT repeat protein